MGINHHYFYLSILLIWQASSQMRNVDTIVNHLFKHIKTELDLFCFYCSLK